MTQPVSPALEAAQIKKLNAEAKKIDLEAKRIAVENDLSNLAIQQAEADIKASVAHAHEAEHNAVASRIAADAATRQEQFTLASDHYHNELHFSCAVDGKSVERALQQLSVWHRQSLDCDMNLTIHSEGGSALDGIHLFDQLWAYSLRGGGTHRVTVTVKGYAASMAAILVQAADERIIGPQSWLMIHKVSAGASGKVTEIMNTAKFLEHMCDRIAGVFVDRAGGKISLETFSAKWEHADWWLSAEQALQYGFVDRIG